MNSARSSVLSNSTLVQQPTKRSPSSKPNCIQVARQRVAKKIANKYSTCENYMILSQINRTIMDKECILKTTMKDIAFDREAQNIELYYSTQKTNEELPELIEYYKYYSQKTMLFIEEYFPLLYQYQEKRKVIEYNRLKVLLNLSDTQKQQNSFLPNKNQELPSGMVNRSRIGITRNLLNDGDSKNKDVPCSNILDQLSLSNFSIKNEHEESLLINRLRNNLSKHIGPTKIKNMSIEELDKLFDFQNKKQIFKPFKENNLNMNFTKNKFNSVKPKKVQRQTTATNTPEQNKQKGVMRRTSAKRNNSCENLIRISVSKTPYEPNTCKIKRKKNLSMDNLNTNTSTPHMIEEKRDTAKLKKVPSRGGDRYQKEKQNTHASKGAQKFADTISDLKIKIQKEKQRLIRASNGAGFASLKRQKTSYTSINTANQRFSKKNYDKLREKTVNVQ